MYLEEVLSGLPDYVQKQLEEVPVIVEDEPSARIRSEMEAGDLAQESSLCGLHSGVPLTERSYSYLPPNSPVILIFRGPILRLAGKSKKSLKKQIRITLLHEIGHHFGFSEEELEEIGYG